MSGAAERTRALRNRRRTRDLRELRLDVPDASRKSVRERVAEQVKRLRPASEEEALRSVEEISEFDTALTDET